MFSNIIFNLFIQKQLETMEYILISVPIEKENKTFNSVHKEFVSKNKQCNVVKYSVPRDLRVKNYIISYFILIIHIN